MYLFILPLNIARAIICLLALIFSYNFYLKTPASNPYLRKLLSGHRILSCPRWFKIRSVSVTSIRPSTLRLWNTKNMYVNLKIYAFHENGFSSICYNLNVFPDHIYLPFSSMFSTLKMWGWISLKGSSDPLPMHWPMISLTIPVNL